MAGRREDTGRELEASNGGGGVSDGSGNCHGGQMHLAGKVRKLVKKTTVYRTEKKHRSSSRHVSGTPEAGSRVSKSGAVKITFSTTKDDYDEKAEVKVRLNNPDLVVEKMLQTLAYKFPPESVMTVAAVPGSTTDASSTSRSHGSSQGSTGWAVGTEPARYFKAANGTMLPEAVDKLTGQPLQYHVRDPVTNQLRRVGPQLYDSDGKPVSGLVIGPDGQPRVGVPLASEEDGLDRHGKPIPFFRTTDGTFLPEAFDSNGVPVPKHVKDPVDGWVRPVGLPVYGPDGAIIPGVVKGADGNSIQGVPCVPLIKLPTFGETDRQASRSWRDLPSEKKRGPPPAYYLGTDGNLYPRATGKDGKPIHGFTRDPTTDTLLPMGTPVIGPDGKAVPHTVIGPDGKVSPGVALMPEGLDARTNKPLAHFVTPDGDLLAEATTPRGTPVVAHVYDPRDGQLKAVGFPCDGDSPHMILGPDGFPTKGLPVTFHRQVRPENRYACYLGADGKPVQIPTDFLGRPLNRFGEDPETGDIKPVGPPMFDQHGKPIPGMIEGPNGEPLSGVPLHPTSIDPATGAPRRVYMTPDGEFLPEATDEHGNPMPGYVRDPTDDQIKPIGPALDTQRVPESRFGVVPAGPGKLEAIPFYKGCDGRPIRIPLGDDGIPLYGFGLSPEGGAPQRVGPPVFDKKGNPVPNYVTGADGRPVPGIPLAVDAYDPRSKEPIFYFPTEDGFLPEATDHTGNPIPGHVRDQKTGAVKPVGAPAYGPDGRPLPGVIRGPHGRPMPGLPLLRPEDEYAPSDVYEVSRGSRPKSNFPSEDFRGPFATDGPHSPKQPHRDYGPASLSGPPRHTPQRWYRTAGGKPVMASSTPPGGHPMAIDPESGSVMPVGRSFIRPDGRPMPNVIEGPDGKPMIGIPLAADEFDPITGAPIPHLMTPGGHLLPPLRDNFARDPADGKMKPVGAPVYGPDGKPIPGMIVGPDGRPTEGIAVTGESPLGFPSVPTSGRGQPQQWYKDSAGRPVFALPGIEGQPSLGVDPVTGATRPVGKPYIGVDGCPVPNMISGPDGHPLPGIPLSEDSLDPYSKQPVPHFMTPDGKLVPQVPGQPSHARDPNDGSIKPVGPSAYGPDGRPIPDMIQTPDGKLVPGIPTMPVGPGFPPTQAIQCARPGQPQGFFKGADGKPIQQYPTQPGQVPMGVDPRTGLPVAVGKQYVGPDGRAIPNTIVGHYGSPCPGLPLCSNSFDPMTGIPLQHYMGSDGRLLPQELGQPNYARDPLDNQVKPVGTPAYGSDGRPIPGMIRGPDGTPIKGIPAWPAMPSRAAPYVGGAPTSPGQPQQWLQDANGQPIMMCSTTPGQPPRALDHLTGQPLLVGVPLFGPDGQIVPNMIAGPDGRPLPGIPLSSSSYNPSTGEPLPQYMAPDGTLIPQAPRRPGHAIDPKDGRTKPVGPQAYDSDGRPIPNMILGPTGQPMEGIPTVPAASPPPAYSDPTSGFPPISDQAYRPTGTPNMPHTQYAPSVDGMGSRRAAEPQSYYKDINGQPIVRVPASPGLPPMAYDPLTNMPMPVGKPFYGPDGKPIPNMIIGPDGRPKPGIPLSSDNFDPATGYPLPSFIAPDGTLLPQVPGRPNYVKDPTDGCSKPVGTQAYDSSGRPILGMINGPNGTPIEGIPAQPTLADFLRPSDLSARSTYPGLFGPPGLAEFPSTDPQTYFKNTDGQPCMRFPSPPGMPAMAIDPRTGQPSLVGRPFMGPDGRSLPGLISTPDGRPVLGIPLDKSCLDPVSGQPVPCFMTPDGRLLPQVAGQPTHAKDPIDGRVKPVGTPAYDSNGRPIPNMIRGPSGRPLEGLPVCPVAPTFPLGAFGAPPTRPDQAQPWLRGADGQPIMQMPTAAGQPPMGAHPITGVPTPIGMPYVGPDGRPVPNMIIGPDGRPMAGLPLGDGFYDRSNGKPVPHFMSPDGQLIPPAPGQPNYAVDPKDGRVKPVGPPAYGPDGRPLPNMIRGSDGAPVEGIPVWPEAPAFSSGYPGASPVAPRRPQPWLRGADGQPFMQMPTAAGQSPMGAHPITGVPTPIGKPYVGPDGRPVPNMIIGPDGRPMTGLPLGDGFYDQSSGKPVPHFMSPDGHLIPQAPDQSNYAIDPKDGLVKTVGLPAYDSNGNSVPGLIAGSDGRQIEGIPTMPVGTTKPPPFGNTGGCPADYPSNHPGSLRPGYPGAFPRGHFGTYPVEADLPSYLAPSHVPMPDGYKPMGSFFLGPGGVPKQHPSRKPPHRESKRYNPRVPRRFFPTVDGKLAKVPSYPPYNDELFPRVAEDPHTGKLLPVGPAVKDLDGRPRKGECLGLDGRVVRPGIPLRPDAFHEQTRRPVPCYSRALDGKPVFPALDERGEPILGTAVDPDTELPRLVGPQYFDLANGTAVVSMIEGPKGRPTEGIPVICTSRSRLPRSGRMRSSSASSLDSSVASNEPFLKLEDGTRLPVMVRPDGTHDSRFGRDPRTGLPVPVGRQYVDPQGRPVKDTICGPGGRPTPGFALADDCFTPEGNVRPLYSYGATTTTTTTGTVSTSRGRSGSHRHKSLQRERRGHPHHGHPHRGHPHHSKGEPMAYFLLPDGSYASAAFCPDGSVDRQHALEPNTGKVLPIGVPYKDRNGRQLPGKIVGPDGRPTDGIPIADDGFHPGTEAPVLHYKMPDGRYLREAHRPHRKGDPPMGVDPNDGLVKPIGRPYCGSDGKPVPGYIEGPDGRPITGIPVIPVPRHAKPSIIAPPSGPPMVYLPTADGGRVPVALDSERRPDVRHAVDPETGELLPVGPAYIGSDGRAVPHTIAGPNGEPLRGIPLAPSAFGDDPQGPPRIHVMTPEGDLLEVVPGGSPSSPMEAYDPKDNRKKQVGPQYVDESGRPVPGMIVGADGKPHKGIPVATLPQVPHKGKPRGRGEPVLYLITADGKRLPVAKDKHGHPDQLHAVDPVTREVLPVGPPYVGPDGVFRPYTIVGPDGRPQKGIPLGPEAIHKPSGKPVPHYLTPEGQPIPVYVEPTGTPRFGEAVDPHDGRAKPVGPQYMSPKGTEMPHMILGPDGRPHAGIPVETSPLSSSSRPSSEGPAPVYRSTDGHDYPLARADDGSLLPGYAETPKGEILPVGRQFRDPHTSKPVPNTIIGPNGNVEYGIPVSEEYLDNENRPVPEYVDLDGNRFPAPLNIQGEVPHTVRNSRGDQVPVGRPYRTPSGQAVPGMIVGPHDEPICGIPVEEPLRVSKKVPDHHHHHKHESPEHNHGKQPDYAPHSHHPHHPHHLPRSHDRHHYPQYDDHHHGHPREYRPSLPDQHHSQIRSPSERYAYDTPGRPHVAEPSGDGLHAKSRGSSRLGHPRSSGKLEPPLIGFPVPHFRGTDGLEYPQAAKPNSKEAWPGHARNPKDGRVMPIGRPAKTPHGIAIPFTIVDNDGKVKEGIPVTPENIHHETGEPKPLFTLLDGSESPAILNPSTGLYDHVRDPQTGEDRPAGTVFLDEDGNVVPHRISDPQGHPQHGIPVIDSTPAGLLPVYTLPDGRHMPVANGSDGYPLLGHIRDPSDNIIKPAGPAATGADGRPIPGHIRNPQGYNVPGIPITVNSTDPQTGEPWPEYITLAHEHLPLARRKDGSPFWGFVRHPEHRTLMPAGQQYFGPDGIPRRGYVTHPDGLAVPGIPVISFGMYGDDDRSARRPEDESAQTRIPAPGYMLYDGLVVPLAVGQDGHPMDGYAQDPLDGRIKPVGPQVRGPDGEVLPRTVIGRDGKPCEGLPLDPKGWNAPNEHPIPHYLTANGDYLPIALDPHGRPIHGVVVKKDGERAPVGLQLFDDAGEPVKGIVIGPDGRKTRGVPLNPAGIPVPRMTIVTPTTSAALPGTPLGTTRTNTITTGVTTQLPTLTHTDAARTDQPSVTEVIKYVEIPIVEERVVTIPKKEYVTVEKREAVVEYEDVEKIVEVPEIRYIEKRVEIPEVHEIVKTIKRQQVVDVPREVIKTVPKVEIRQVEKFVEVPGEIIEVPKPYIVEHQVPVPRYINKEVPTVVAQTLQASIVASDEPQEVECVVTEPKIVTVDIYVPKLVDSAITATGGYREIHKTVDVPAAQFNSLIETMNADLERQALSDLFVQEDGKGIPLLPAGERLDIQMPRSSEWTESHSVGQVRCQEVAGSHYQQPVLPWNIATHDMVHSNRGMPVALARGDSARSRSVPRAQPRSASQARPERSHHRSSSKKRHSSQRPPAPQKARGIVSWFKRTPQRDES